MGNVDFNNLRKQLAEKYNEICNKIQILSYVEEGERLLVIDDRIKNDLDEMRGYISSILLCYEPGNDKVQSLDKVAAELLSIEIDS